MLRERVAIADVAVLGMVLEVINQKDSKGWEARIIVSEVFKGQAGKEVRLRYQYRTLNERRVVYPGSRYLFFLVRRAFDGYYRPVNRHGILKGTKGRIARVSRLTKQNLASWKDNPNGIRLLLYSKRPTYQHNQGIDLKLYIQNGTNKRVRVYVPLDSTQRTRVKVVLTVRRNGKPVVPRKLLTPNQYHELHLNRTLFVLNPGELFHRLVSDINRKVFPLEKKDLGFLYYPMDKPGRYNITVTLNGLTHDNKPTKSNPLHLIIK